MTNNTKKKLVISDKVWLLISLVTALALWYVLSIGEKTGRSFPYIQKVVAAIGTMIDRGAFWKDVQSSLKCVFYGFGLGFATALPIAFLMAWYTPIQKIVEPWINFIRNIPALGYAPLIVIIFGVGQKPAIILIWICTFMTMSITIYQGIKNIDVTLIKAPESFDSMLRTRITYVPQSVMPWGVLKFTDMPELVEAVGAKLVD